MCADDVILIPQIEDDSQKLMDTLNIQRWIGQDLDNILSKKPTVNATDRTFNLREQTLSLKNIYQYVGVKCVTLKPLNMAINMVNKKDKLM